MTITLQVQKLEQAVTKFQNLYTSSKKKSKFLRYFNFFALTAMFALTTLIVLQRNLNLDFFDASIIATVNLLVLSSISYFGTIKKAENYYQIKIKCVNFLRSLNHILDDLKRYRDYLSADQEINEELVPPDYTDDQIYQLILGFYRELGELKIAAFTDNSLAQINDIYTSRT